jgi:VanZ family protein
MKRILLVVVALIVYGSLYPWQFQSAHYAESPLWILFHSWPRAFDRFFYRDLVINIVIYVPFGAFCFLSLTGGRAMRVIVTLLAAAVLSASIEITQLFEPTRVCSAFDLLCNTAGAGLGILLAGAFPAAISHVVEEAGELGAFRLNDVVTLLYLWIGAQLFPFFPALSQTAVRAKLHALLSAATWPARDFFENLAAWLAVSALLELLAGKKRFAPLLTLALISIPLQLFIADRTITASEIAGALLGLLAWKAFHHKRPAGIFALAALIAAGLVPLHWSADPQPFTWIPFLPMLRSPWVVGLLILLRKCFLYGAAIWLLANGRSWLPGIAAVAASLALVEAIQTHLPGHSPEITDPLLAVIIGSSLMLLHRHSTRTDPALRT